MSDIGESIQVGKGVVSETDDGIRFAGSYIFPAADQQPVRVEVAVFGGKSLEFDVTLREGQTFQVAGQSWRIDKIHSEGSHDWTADLTRIA